MSLFSPYKPCKDIVPSSATVVNAVRIAGDASFQTYQSAKEPISIYSYILQPLRYIKFWCRILLLCTILRSMLTAWVKTKVTIPTTRHRLSSRKPSLNLHLSKSAVTGFFLVLGSVSRPLADPITDLALDDEICGIGVVVKVVQLPGQLARFVQSFVVIRGPFRHINLDWMCEVHGESYSVIMNARVEDDAPEALVFSEFVDSERLCLSSAMLDLNSVCVFVAYLNIY